MNRPATRLTCLALVATAAAAGLAGAQPVIQMEQPRPIEMHVQRPTLSLDVEGNSLRTSRADGTPTTKDTTLDWTPSLGLLFDGSIYDAKLLQFNLETETGFTKGKRRVDDGTGHINAYDRDFTIEQYNGTATLLRDKPYSVTLFGAKNRVQRDYDQFNRFNADIENYGAVLRNVSDNWNWNLRLAHSDEQVDNRERPSAYRENLLNLNVQNQRSDNNRTTLRYDSRDFRRQEGDAPAYSGVQRTFYALDEEYFTTNQNNRLTSALTVSDISESISDSGSLSLREDFRHEHRANLWSGAIYGYDQRYADGARFEEHRGEVYVEHRLYENLNSRLDLHGERGSGQGDSETRYGPSLAEHYSRRLSDFGRIGVDLDGRLDHIAPSASGSSVATVIGEAVRLDDQRPAFLTRPNVQTAGIVVTDESRARRYLEGSDYRIVQRGAITEIQRVFGGAIPRGATVRVDYPAEAGASASLDQVTRRGAIELDLFRRRAFFYAEQQAAESMGGSSLRFEDYRDTVLGVKSRWSSFEAGAEHVAHTADTLSYGGVNYYADLFWDWESLSAKLHAGRSNLDYRRQGGSLDTRRFTATLGWSPVSALTVQGFAGQYYERTINGDRDLRTLEGHVLFHYSRLSLDCSYRYEDESTAMEHYERHYFLAELTRHL